MRDVYDGKHLVFTGKFVLLGNDTQEQFINCMEDFAATYGWKLEDDYVVSDVVEKFKDEE